MNYENLTPVVGVITNISTQDGDCCTQVITLSVEGQPVNMILSDDTFVVDTMRLMPGMRIAAFYDTTQPVPLIYPPQYRALAAARLKSGQTAFLAYFNEQLTDEDGMLHLNISRSTKVLTPNGQLYHGPLGRQVLLVIYSASTRSIPAQTAPEVVIVFCGRFSEENS